MPVTVTAAKAAVPFKKFRRFIVGFELVLVNVIIKYLLAITLINDK